MGILSELLRAGAQGLTAYGEGTLQGEDIKRQRLERERQQEREVRMEALQRALLELNIEGKRKALQPQPAAPLTGRVSRGGVTVDDVPLADVGRILDQLPEDPPETLSPSQQRLAQNDRLRQANEIVNDMVNAGHGAAVIDRRLNQMGLGGLIDPYAIHGRLARVVRDRGRDELVDRRRVLDIEEAEDAPGQSRGPISVGGRVFDADGGIGIPKRSTAAAQTVTESTDTGGLDPSEIEQARRLVRGVENPKAALRQAGYSETQITAILNGNG